MTSPKTPLVTDPVAHAELRKTLELIVADVNSWDQEQWGIKIPLRLRYSAGETTGETTACRTAFCVAGHYAVNVAGYVPLWYEAHLMPADDYAADGSPGESLFGLSEVVVPIAGTDDTTDADGTSAGIRRDVASVAAAAFGLSGSAANALFSEGNSLRRVLDVAYWVTGGAVDLYPAYDDLVARDADFAARERDTERHAADVAFSKTFHGTW